MIDDISSESQAKSISTLNKAGLAEALATNVGLDKNAAKQFVEAFFETISRELIAGNTVKLPGLGNFSVRDKIARPGRNLKTGEMVVIDPRRVVTFHGSGTLKGVATSRLIDEE